ncbi:MAG: spermidine synthase [Paenibacillus sp.]|jgi:spermidine synthase|nr:spermidine synthase [Paenibacillus sp.]
MEMITTGTPITCASKENDRLQLRYKTSGPNAAIEIYDTSELYGEKGSFRIMQFSGEAVQGAMDLERPERIVFEYPRAIIHLMKQNDPAFEDVFAIGHGIGTIAGYFAEKRFKVAELDDKVVEISKAWFGCSGDHVVIGDGRQLLCMEKPDTYDYIVLDAFNAQGTPRHLISSEFFRIARDKLHAGGAILMNLIGRGDNDRLINAVHTTLGEHFPHTVSFSMPSNRITDAKNIIMMGSGKPIRFQARHMAGFAEFAPGPGHLILDGIGEAAK